MLADATIGGGSAWAETAAPVIRDDAALAAAIEIFRLSPGLRGIPVVDRDDRPVGILPETAVRRILFNPYGHALVQNPSFGLTLTGVTMPCATAEIDWSAARKLERHAAVGGEALILTRDGRYHSVLGAPALLALAARVEAEAAEQRIARAERVDAGVSAYLTEAERLTHELHLASGAIADMSRMLAERAATTRDRTAAVAAASSQTSTSLEEVARRERALVGTLNGIAVDMNDARAIRSKTGARLGEAAARVNALAERATAIDRMLALIREVASRTRLLALNASIEAARAGAAGSGFNVVANEVKALADQTTGAVTDIARQVDRIGGLLNGVVDDQEAIRGAVAMIDTLSVAIDTAVEGQVATTAIVSDAVQQSAFASRQIGDDAGRIGEDAARLQQDTITLLTFAETLTAVATRMKQRTRTFVEAVAG